MKVFLLIVDLVLIGIAFGLIIAETVSLAEERKAYKRFMAELYKMLEDKTQDG